MIVMLTGKSPEKGRTGNVSERNLVNAFMTGCGNRIQEKKGITTETVMGNRDRERERDRVRDRDRARDRNQERDRGRDYDRASDRDRERPRERERERGRDYYYRASHERDRGHTQEMDGDYEHMEPKERLGVKAGDYGYVELDHGQEWYDGPYRHGREHDYNQYERQRYTDQYDHHHDPYRSDEHQRDCERLKLHELEYCEREPFDKAERVDYLSRADESREEGERF